MAGDTGYGFNRKEDERSYEAALAQGDIANAARLGLRNVEAKIAETRFVAARDLMEKIKAMLGTGGDATLRARAHLLSGKLSTLTGSLREAEAEVREAAAICGELGNEEITADALLTLGSIHAASNRLSEAKAAYDAALGFYASRPGYDSKRGEALTALGDYHMSLGHVDEAEVSYQAARGAYEASLGDPRSDIGRANVRLAMGELYASLARLTEAERMLYEALQLYRSHSVPLGEANALTASGDVYAVRDRFKEAADAYKQALAILRQVGVPEWEERVTRALSSPARAPRPRHPRRAPPLAAGSRRTAPRGPPRRARRRGARHTRPSPSDRPSASPARGR